MSNQHQLTFKCHSISSILVFPGMTRYIPSNEILGFQIRENESLQHENLNAWTIPKEEVVKGNILGQGAFGVVYKGRWKGTKNVAIKTMNRGYMAEDFMKEANIMKNLHHPYVVKCYGVLRNSSSVSIVMEYLENGSLLSYLQKNKSSISVADQLKFCDQVRIGMAYLHREDIIHRDLAARNCLVAADLTVKVADFGLSRYVPDDLYFQSSYGAFALRWAPPEVYQRRYTKKADVWAFGILMWEIFTYGRTPYEDLSNHEVMAYVKEGNTLSRPCNCPEAVYKKVMKMCWKYNKDNRPSFSDICIPSSSCNCSCCQIYSFFQ